MLSPRLLSLFTPLLLGATVQGAESAPIDGGPAAPVLSTPDLANDIGQAPPAATTTDTPSRNDSTTAMDFSFFRPQAKDEDGAAQPRWHAGVALIIGYDSNILLENPDLPEATDEHGAAWSVEGQAQVRALQGTLGRVTLGGSARNDEYPVAHEADLVQFGGFASGILTTPLLGFEPGIVISRYQFRLDEEIQADTSTLTLFANRIQPQAVDIVAIGAQRLDYREDPDASGRQYDLSYRRWFLLGPDEVWRRVEAGLRLGANRADAAFDRYRALTPSVAGLYRLEGGFRPVAGTIDLLARGTLELRQCNDTEVGEDHSLQILTLRGQADYWWNAWLSTGPYLGFTRRTSTVESERFNRLQLGLRLAATW